MAGSKCINPFWPMSLSRHTWTCDLITLGRNLIFHCNMTNAVRQTYLYKWFNLTWQDLNVSLHSDHSSYADILLDLIRSHLAGTTYIIPFWPMFVGRHTCTIYSTTLGIPFWPMPLGRQTCTRDLITLGNNWMYHSILTYTLSTRTCTSDVITLTRNLM